MRNAKSFASLPLLTRWTTRNDSGSEADWPGRTSESGDTATPSSPTDDFSWNRPATF